MKSVHALTRQLHLFSGLILAVAVLFYTISGVTFVYAQWMPSESATAITTRLAIPASTAPDDGALRAFVEKSVASKGRTDGLVSVKPDGLRQRWVWPTGSAEVVVSPSRDSLTITRTRFGPIRTLRNFHVLVGARGGMGYFAWWVLLDVLSLAMLLFAVTGLLLWYRTTKDRRLGWLLLAGSWLYTIGLIGYLWLT
ncbi:MAG: PepSY-associated TM helix domain-containing protein [Gemmatimonas sp.]